MRSRGARWRNGKRCKTVPFSSRYADTVLYWPWKSSPAHFSTVILFIGLELDLTGKSNRSHQNVSLNFNSVPKGFFPSKETPILLFNANCTTHIILWYNDNLSIIKDNSFFLYHNRQFQVKIFQIRNYVHIFVLNLIRQKKKDYFRVHRSPPSYCMFSFKHILLWDPKINQVQEEK